MALTGRVWGAGKLLLLGGALFLTYVLFTAAAMRVALKSREVVVPSLAGKTVNDATAVLFQSGLNLRVEEARRPDPKVPAGQILSQDPEAGARTRRERSVQVWVRWGPRSMIADSPMGDENGADHLPVQREGCDTA